MFIVYKCIGGFLAISPKPAGGTQLASALTALQSDGVTSIVSLLEPAEALSLALGDEGALCRERGIDFESYPITDFGVPGDHRSFDNLVRDTSLRIEAGEGVLAHCRGGIGRSGLFAISVLLKLGYPLDVAIQQCSSRRGVQVPETAEQIAWLQSEPIN